MGGEHGLGDAPGLEQAETQQHRIAHTPPYRPGNIPVKGDILYQDTRIVLRAVQTVSTSNSTMPSNSSGSILE
jgi:hypothetical protein